MKAYCAIVIIFLFSYQFAVDHYVFRPSKELRVHSKLYQSYPKTTRNRLFSLFFGENRGLQKEEKRAFSSLGLFHLLTPSGLHYSLLSKLPQLLLPSRFFCFFNLFIYLLLKYFGAYSAISRVVLYRYLGKVLKKINRKYRSIGIIFLLTFLIDLMITPFQSCGLSLLFSFIFWGVIIYYAEKKLLCLYLMFATQLLVSTLMGVEINFIAIIANPFMTFLFLIFYPLVVFNTNLCFFHFQTIITEFLTSAFFDLVLWIDQTFSFFKFYPSMTVFFLLMTPFLFSSLKKSLLILLLILPWQHNPTIKYKLHSTSKYSTFKIGKLTLLKEKTYLADGFTLFFIDKKKCTFILKNFYWEIKCKDKKRPRKNRGQRLI